MTINGNGISFSGLASGLDTQAIIAQLVALERIPIQQLEARRDEEQQRLDLVGTFGDLVKAFKEKAEAIATSADFFSFAVGVSQEGVAAISAAGGAIAGSHTLDVVTTASTDRWAFDGVLDPDADLAAADGQAVSFDVNGTSYSVTVDQVDSSLNELAAAINSAAGIDVHASVVNVGTEANPSHQLVLASRESGEDNRITNIGSSVAGLTINYVVPDAAGNPQSANNVTVGRNAQAYVDGLLIERSDNDFGDVLEGVSISVLSETTQPITFTVEPDKEAIKQRIQDFVDAHNEVIEFANQQNAYSEEPDAISALFGDSLLSDARRNISRALFDIDPAVVQSDTEGYSTLSLIGIKQANDGTLSIDDRTLDAKLTADLDLFADLFVDFDGFDNGGALPNTPEYFADTTADSGLADKLVREIDRMFGSFAGPIDPVSGERISLDAIFDARKDALNGKIDRFNDQIDQMERRIDSFEQTQVIRFARLEELMGALNAQGSALSQALLSLPGVN